MKPTHRLPPRPLVHVSQFHFDKTKSPHLCRLRYINHVNIFRQHNQLLNLGLQLEKQQKLLGFYRSRTPSYFLSRASEYTYINTLFFIFFEMTKTTYIKGIDIYTYKTGLYKAKRELVVYIYKKCYEEKRVKKWWESMRNESKNWEKERGRS